MIQQEISKVSEPDIMSDLLKATHLNLQTEFSQAFSKIRINYKKPLALTGWRVFNCNFVFGTRRKNRKYKELAESSIILCTYSNFVNRFLDSAYVLLMQIIESS